MKIRIAFNSPNRSDLVLYDAAMDWFAFNGNEKTIQFVGRRRLNKQKSTIRVFAKQICYVEKFTE